MKLKFLKILLAGSFLLVVASCYKEEALGSVDDIPGLGGDTWVKGPIDFWIYDTLTVPYNITAKYRWDQGELDQDLTQILVPPKEEQVIPCLSSIKKVWIDNYQAEAGELFIKRYMPKLIELVGSGSFIPGLGVKQGSAEGGRKITLFAVNDFRTKSMAGYVPSDSFNVKELFETIEHEFGHVLHQNIIYPQEFKLLSVGLYTSNWNNVTRTEALQNGFVTPYAMSKTDDDFVETIAIMLTEGKAGFDNLVNSITGTSPGGTTADEAKARLRQKEALVVGYYKDAWNINFYSLQARTRATIVELIK